MSIDFNGFLLVETNLTWILRTNTGEVESWAGSAVAQSTAQHITAKRISRLLPKSLALVASIARVLSSGSHRSLAIDISGFFYLNS